MPLHLIGTTPLPETDYLALPDEQIASLRATVMQAAYARHEKPNVAWQRVAKGIEVQKTLHRLATAGVRARYHVCDVRDRARLAQVLDQVRRTDGPIVGVVHGAGVESTGRFQKKTPELVAATVGVKFLGAMALVELTQGDPLRYFLAFGSLSGRFGGVGQTDYALANDALAKLIDWLRGQRPDCVSVAFHWPGWSEVGMSVRPESRTSLELAGHRLMQPAEGVTHLLAELAAGGPAGEVLLLDQHELPPDHLAKAAG
jgi:NAD(P)-dependent dehydrogenase (short-subunit alcohol dehydrogenase family)